MKTPSTVLLLLLLWAGLVVVAAEHKDLQEKSADTVSTQHTCQSDIHNVLREMTALITEQRVELRYTKTQMEALETRLRASEKTVEEQRVELRQTEARLTDSQSLVQRLDKENKAQEKTLNELKEKQEEQAAAVRAVGGSVNLTGSQVEELRREREERRVSFSASLVTSGVKTFGPFSEPFTLIYKHVITNIGNAYNPNTGVFTAPVRGVYYFVLVLYGNGRKSTPTGATLHKNGEQVITAVGHQPTYNLVVSNGASLLLEVGDVVCVKLWRNAWVIDSYNHLSTFSGHLLFSM